MAEHRASRVAAGVLLALTGTWSIAGHAEQILAATPLVYGSLASATPFSVLGAGSVTVVLSDLGWPAKLASLTFAATTPAAVVATMSGAGELSFQVGAGGVYDAVVGAVAAPQSLLGLGWYSLVIDFAPLAAPVPLPASLWVLLTGLGVLGLLRARVSGGAVCAQDAGSKSLSSSYVALR